MSCTSTSKKSSLSSGASLSNQGPNQFDGPARGSAQPAPGRDRGNPMSPTTTARRTSSQANYEATARLPSLAETRKSRSSSGVLGLPGAIDPSLLGDFFDLDQLNANDGLTNNGLDLHNLDWAANDNSDLTAGNFDATLDRYIDALQYDSLGVDLGLSQTQPEPYSSLQGPSETNYGLGIELDSSMLHPKESYDGQPFELNNWDILQPTSLFEDTNSGLSALPGGTSMQDISQYLMPSGQQYRYPDPLAPLYPANPYYPSMQQQYPRYYAEDTPTLADYYDMAKQHGGQPVRKRKSSQFSSSVVQVGAPAVKRGREDSDVKPSVSPVPTRTDSLVSEDGSLSKPVKSGVLKVGEKPKKCEDKPWVRINNTTKGETTRTARINQHAKKGHKYKVKGLPYGDWSSTRYTFEYSQNNGMHEFKKRTMSARQIHEYITQYPGDNLRIWIQPVASDSARRYASASHSHCRFEKCPVRKYTGKGTAEVGNYRVAFDEKHKTYGAGVVDPYDCVGYAHLYCMERFLDFAYICQVADVRVDQRVSMEKEPKGHFASAFGSKHYHEAALAKRFIDAASRGRLAETHEFADYPVHKDYARGAPKPHERTLIYALYCMNIKHRARSQMKQFILQRTIRPGAFPVHRGDMEVKLVDKKIESLLEVKDFLKTRSKKDLDYAAYYDRFHPEIKVRIAECLALREQFIAEDKLNANKSSRSRKHGPEHDEDDSTVLSSKSSRKCRVYVSESDSETPSPKYQSRKRRASKHEEQDDHEPRPSREGLRQKQRINYTEPQDTPLIGFDVPSSDNTTAGALVVPPPEFDIRKESCSNLFPAANDDTWGSLDLDLAPLDGSETCLTQEQIDALLNAAYRRKSSTLSNGPGVSAVRSPCRMRGVGGVAQQRRASFRPQPVTQSREFRLDDPPMRVADGRDGVGEKNGRSRRSAGRVGKRSGR